MVFFIWVCCGKLAVPRMLINNVNYFTSYVDVYKSSYYAVSELLLYKL
jgi:hypothetical protein